jgi:integrase
MESIGPRQVQQAINRMTEKLKPATVRSYYGVLSHLFNDAVDLEIIGRSPCRAIKLPKLSHGVKRVIGPEDLHRLADEVGPDWRLLIYLGGVMGLRIGEALGLHWTDIDLEERTITIARTVSEAGGRVTLGEPKTRSSLRTLVFPAPLVDEFTTHRDRSGGENPAGLVFHDSIGGPVRASNLRYRVLDPAVQAIGLDGLTFHGLRHSAATEWVASGVDARTVQHRLGHTDPGLVLRLYAHSSSDADRHAAEATAKRYWPK